jgi:hypothetical protein
MYSEELKEKPKFVTVKKKAPAGVCTSSFTEETINRRLETLAAMPQEAAVISEIDYLEKLKARKFPKE